MRTTTALILTATAAVLLLTACGKPASEATDAPPMASAGVPVPTAEELATREAELARREQALALREREEELARREAGLATREEPATAKAPVAGPAPKPTTAAARPSTPAVKPSSTFQPVKPPAVPAVTRLTVPTGTRLSLALSQPLSTKTARAGELFEATLAEAVSVDGRSVLPRATRVTGTITDVVSGSSRIGGVPTLGLRFDGLELADGQKIAINGELVEQGKSDTGQDTAKILGGAAAGAILGHQIKRGDGGKIIGGLLGGAIGAVAARKTGTEVTLDAGAPLSIELGAPVEVIVR